MRTSKLHAAFAGLLAVSMFASDLSAQECLPDARKVTLVNPAPAQQDYFGSSASVSGNLTVVGAYHSSFFSLWGAARVYDATTGALVSTLDPPVGSGSTLGQSVAISGNLVVAGASLTTVEEEQYAGKAYVYDASTGALVATLNNPDPEENAFFGFSVAISGNAAVVGAFSQRPGVQDAGVAYVFNATTGALTATLNNPEPATSDNGDYFGASVAISGNSIVVGARGDYAGGIVNAGAAYVFDATTGALTATLNNPAPEAYGYFGLTVAISEGVAVVGAPLVDRNGFNESGVAHVFDAATGNLIVTLNNPTPAANDGFGVSLAISGDVVVAGVSVDLPGGLTGKGSVYFFNALTGALMSSRTSPFVGTDDFGYAVAIDGEAVVVGAPGEDPGGFADAGAAYVYGCGPTGRVVGDFDDSGCSDVGDFLFLIDNWMADFEGTPLGIADMLALLDNWKSGLTCGVQS